MNGEKKPNLLESQPVLTGGAVTGIVMAGLFMAVKLNWLNLDDAQLGSIETFVGALLALLLPVLISLWPRSRVTPLADPHTADKQPAMIVPVAQAQQMGLLPDEWSDSEGLPTGYGRKDLR